MDEAIAAHLPLVEAQCRKLKLRPHQRSWDDAYSDGSEALWRALISFDPARYRSFEAFAAHRIYYSIIDGVRSREGRTLRAEFDDSVKEFDWLLDDGIDPETRAVERDQIDHEMDRLRAIDARLPEMVVLRARGLTYAQIGRRFGVGRVVASSILALRFSTPSAAATAA